VSAPQDCERVNNSIYVELRNSTKTAHRSKDWVCLICSMKECRLLTAGHRVQSRGSVCGICGEQSGTGTGSSACNLVLPCHLPFHHCAISWTTRGRNSTEGLRLASLLQLRSQLRRENSFLRNNKYIPCPLWNPKFQYRVDNSLSCPVTTFQPTP
jgi:hypothetical protein